MSEKQEKEQVEVNQNNQKQISKNTFTKQKQGWNWKSLFAKNNTNNTSSKPTTAQQTIPFETMYYDGICKVTSKYYTKMIEFTDVIYELLDVEEQAEVLELYSQFINYFSPSIQVQLFFFHRQVNEKKLKKPFVIPLQEDGFDDIRLEFSEMLSNRSLNVFVLFTIIVAVLTLVIVPLLFTAI